MANIFITHIPRTGGVWRTVSMIHFLEDYNVYFDHELKKSGSLGNVWVGHNTKVDSLPDDVIKICVLRHPLDRFVSAYNHHVWSMCNEELAIDHQYTFEEFIEIFAEKQLYVRSLHTLRVRHNISVTLDNFFEQFDYIFNTGRLDKFAKTFSLLVGQDMKWSDKIKNSSQDVQQLTEADFDIIYDIIKEIPPYLMDKVMENPIIKQEFELWNLYIKQERRHDDV